MNKCKKQYQAPTKLVDDCDDLKEVYVYRNKVFSTCKECEEHTALPEGYLVHAHGKSNDRLIFTEVFLSEANAKLYVKERKDNLFYYKITWTKFKDASLYNEYIKLTKEINERKLKSTYYINFWAGLWVTILNVFITTMILK